jgi:hypothetical protein
MVTINQLLELAGSSYLHLLAAGFLLGGMPFLFVYILINKTFSMKKNLQTVLAGGIILVPLTLFSLFYLDHPPYFLLICGWALLAAAASHHRKTVAG